MKSDEDEEKQRERSPWVSRKNENTRGVEASLCEAGMPSE